MEPSEKEQTWNNCEESNNQRRERKTSRSKESSRQRGTSRSMKTVLCFDLTLG